MLTIWIMFLLSPMGQLPVDCHGGHQHHKSPFLPKTKAMSFIPENHWLHPRDTNLCRDDEDYCEENKSICRQYVEPSREEACRETPCPNGFTCYLEVPCRAHFRRGCQDVACLSKACKNRASCHHVTGSNVICSCTHGYYGDVCEFVDACLAAPCLNGGSRNRVASSFDCSCSNGYAGSTCETDVACLSKACKNGASCHHVTGSHAMCSCTHGYYGEVCEFVDSCVTAPCLNGGSCNRVASSFDCSCSNRYNGSTCETDCRPGPADILFIMDASYSTEKHFNESKASVTAIVNKLSLGADDFLVAVITYSLDVTVEFTFNQFTDKASVITTINKLSSKRGPSYLDKALAKSKQMISSASTYGARTSVRKYIIIISDGLSTLRKKAINDAWQLKSQGVRVVAIGNGEQVDQKELLNLATAKQYVFPAGRENDVTNAILMETVSSSCTDCSLHKMADILFLVDVSLHQTSLQLTLDALRDLEQKVLDFNSDTHVGMATFDLTVQSKFPLNNITERDDILDNSQIGIATTNMTSNISAALAFARHTGFNGSRSDARKMLVVFSNEGWTDLDDVRQQREALNMDNVTGVFVTVGRYADLDSAYSVTEKPSHVYYIESHADFDRFEALVAQTTHAECPDNIFDVRQ